jgi:hypothetical protein
MSDTRKLKAQIFDMDKNELLEDSELTVAIVKRFIKLYSQVGITARAVRAGVEVLVK